MGAEDRLKSVSPGGPIQAAVTNTSNILWAVYRAYFSGVVAQVVPAHTRDAAFQLFCDLRANTPKDSKFLSKHARAFVPHTATGWLALGSTLAFSLSGLLGLACIALSLSVMGIYTGLAVALVGGVVLSVVLAGVALTLFLTACCSGVFATGALLSYCSLSTTLAVARYLLLLMLGPPAPDAKRPAERAEQELMAKGADSGGNGPVTGGPQLASHTIKAMPTPAAGSGSNLSPSSRTNHNIGEGSPRVSEAGLRGREDVSHASNVGDLGSAVGQGPASVLHPEATMDSKASSHPGGAASPLGNRTGRTSPTGIDAGMLRHRRALVHPSMPAQQGSPLEPSRGNLRPASPPSTNGSTGSALRAAADSGPGSAAASGLEWQEPPGGGALGERAVPLPPKAA